eukprot:770152-Amphidinium_carterae.1
MAQPAYDGRSASLRNVRISVASFSNTSNTSTLPRIVGMSHGYRHIPDHKDFLNSSSNPFDYVEALPNLSNNSKGTYATPQFTNKTSTLEEEDYSWLWR